MIPSIFQKDWFNRSSEFTSLQESEISKLTKEQLSKFLYNESEIEKIFSSNQNLEKECLSIVRSLGLPKVNIQVTRNENEAYTDGKLISVTSKFSREYDNNYDIMDNIIAMTVHECCHCLYTDFKYGEFYCKNYSRYVHHLYNIIEDELIEQRLGYDHPGFIKFLSKLKFGVFDKEIKMGENEFGNIGALLFAVIRYPKYISKVSEDILEKHAELFEEIHEILKDTDCFNTNNEFCTRCSWAAAVRIYKLLIKMFGEDDTQQILNILEMLFKMIKKELGESLSELSELTEDEKNKYSNNSSKKSSSEIKIKQIKEKNAQNYNRIYREISKYVNDFRKILCNNSSSVQYKEVKCLRNGSLDASRLPNALAGCQTVYKQTFPCQTKSIRKCALTLVIDESGSMDYYKIQKMAQDIVVLIYEALSIYDQVEIYVYGHGDNVHRYMDKYRKDKYVLGNLQKQSQQDDAVSYKLIVDDVRKQTKLPIMFFVITDSLYASATDDMTNVLEYLKSVNADMHMIQLSERELNTSNKELFGDKYVNFHTRESYTTLIAKIGKLIRAKMN